MKKLLIGLAAFLLVAGMVQAEPVKRVDGRKVDTFKRVTVDTIRGDASATNDGIKIDPDRDGTDEITISDNANILITPARDTGDYIYLFNIDDGGDKNTPTVGAMTGGAAQKTYGLNLLLNKPNTDAATGDSNDALIKGIYNNHAANDANFIARGLNLGVNNRAGGTMGMLDHALGSANRGTSPTVRGLTLTAENYGTTTDAFEGLRIRCLNEGAKATAENGLIISNENNSIASAMDAAIKIQDAGVNNGYEYGLDMGGSTIGTAALRFPDNTTQTTAGAPDQNLWETIASDGTSIAANSPTDTLTLAGGGINVTSQSGDTITITGTEVDGSTTNEINTITADDTNSTTGLGITIAGGGINATTVAGNTVTVTGTEVDGSTTNEINTITCPDANVTAGLGITIAQSGPIAITETADTITFTVTEADPLSATKALDNLASVAINTTLLPASAGSAALGSEALFFSTANLGTALTFEGATDNDYQTTLTAVDPTVADKSINIPNANGTIAVSATSPMAVSVLGDLSIAQATTSVDGYVVQADWDSWTDHVADNTQAHSDYFLNSGADTAGAGAGFAWTFDASAGADPTLTFGDGTVAVAGTLSATALSGDLTGDVTGNVSGSSGSCTGNSATATILETTRAIYGNNFDGSAPLTGIIASTYGGTGNGFTAFTGPTTAERVFTLPDATSTLLYSGGALGTPSGGTLTNCTGLPYTGLANGTDGNLITWAADATIAVVATGDAGQVLTSGGVGVAPTFQAAAAETLAATLAAGADANDVNITSGADIALDSLSSDGATIVIGLGDENTYTQTGGTTHAFTLGSSAGDDFTIDGTGFVYEGDTKSVGIGGPDIPKGSLNVFRSASDVNPVLLVEHVSNLTSSSYRDGLIVGEEGWDIGDMVLSLWTDGTNDVAYIEAARLSSYYIVPLVLQANGGNVGIGVTDPDQKLEVAGRIKMTTWTADGDTAAYRDTATDSIALVASDRRLKKNITPLTSALDIVKQLETYKYNDLDEEDTKKKRLGLMGGEVLEIIPELTFEIIRTTVDEVTGENIEKIYYGVHYDKLPVLLLGAIKEQQAEIEILKLRIDKLEKKNAN